MTATSAADRLLAMVLDVLRDVGRGRLDAVDPDTPLLASGVLDSLAIAEVVESLERRLGADVPPELILPENFATPRTLVEALRKAGWAR